MGELFWNKVFGAILGTLLVIFAIREAAHELTHPHELEEPAYIIEVAEDANGGDVVEEAAPDIGTLLAEANTGSGETFARTLCGSCHTFGEGEPTITGPNLWNIVNRPVAVEDFGYTSAMAGLGGEWTYERLWDFLESPNSFVSGTAMTFAGLPREDQRANIIAFLGGLSENPAPFPAPAAPDDASGELLDAVVEGAQEAAGQAADAVSDVVEDAVDAVTPDEE